MNYYSEVRTHLSLGKDAPVSRVVHAVGGIVPKPILGGLHHEYVRIWFCARDTRCDPSRSPDLIWMDPPSVKPTDRPWSLRLSARAAWVSRSAAIAVSGRRSRRKSPPD